MTTERRTDSTHASGFTGLEIVTSPEVQQLLFELKEEAVRTYGCNGSSWPHEAAVLRFLNS